MIDNNTDTAQDDAPLVGTPALLIRAAATLLVDLFVVILVGLGVFCAMTLMLWLVALTSAAWILEVP